MKATNKKARKSRKQKIKQMIDSLGLYFLEYSYTEVQDTIASLSFMERRAFNELHLEYTQES
jgi:hypothetical protein